MEEKETSPLPGAPELNAPRAKAIFEQRNRAFRILYDTVLDIAAAAKEDVVPVLCKNLCIMTNARSTAIATFDSARRQLTLEAVSRGKDDIVIPDRKDPANRIVMDEEMVQIYKYTRLRKCLRPEMCFDRIFPDSATLKNITCYRDSKCYSFSCVFEDELLACGLLEFAPDQPFKMKDMVDTYMSMAGMILQRANAVRDLELSKRRFKTLIENCPVGIAVVSRSQKIVEINSLALNMLERRREDILGSCCKDVFCLSEDKDRPCPYWDKGHEIMQEEKYLKVGPDTTVPIITTVYPVEIEGEDYVIETFVDISERKKQEDARLRLEKQLYQAQKLEGLGTLAAGIAHEINTPIQFINDNMRFIEESLNSIIKGVNDFRAFAAEDRDKLDVETILGKMEELHAETEFTYLCEELPKALGETKEGLGRVAGIVRAMKDFSHIDTSERARADINKSVRSAVMITQNNWKYVAEITTELDEKLPMPLCFINDINQAVMNLIINAVHAIEEKQEKQSNKDKGLITLRTFSRDDHVVISVSDTGTGIPENVRDKILEPFFTTKPVGKGTGQGLSMTYATIVEKHGGRFSFETETGKGTTFFIELPFERE